MAHEGWAGINAATIIISITTTARTVTIFIICKTTTTTIIPSRHTQTAHASHPGPTHLNVSVVVQHHLLKDIQHKLAEDATLGLALRAQSSAWWEGGHCILVTNQYTSSGLKDTIITPFFTSHPIRNRQDVSHTQYKYH